MLSKEREEMGKGYLRIHKVDGSTDRNCFYDYHNDLINLANRDQQILLS